MKNVILLLVLAQGLILSDLLIPYSSNDGLVSPFLFANQEMYLRTYAWMLSNRFCWVIFMCCIHELSKGTKYTGYLKIFLWMEVLVLIEWTLNYNNTWFYLFETVGIGLSHFFLIFKGLIVYNIWKDQ